MFFSNQLLFSEHTLNQIHIYAGRWLDFLMVAFTHCGDEIFYILLIPFLFWCVNKRLATIVGLTFLFSTVFNDIIKFAFNKPRPNPLNLAEGIAQLNNVYCPPSSPGFPSGHAQNAVVFWGLLAYTIRRRLFSIFAVFMIVAISYSRLYLGVHFFGDVAGGIIIGCMVFTCAVLLIPYFDRLWNLQLLSAIIIFVMMPIAVAIAFPDDATVKSLGVFSGFSIGLIVTKNRFGEPSFKLVPALVNYFIGITVLLLLKEGIKVILPSVAYADFIRYWIIGGWISFGAPFTFNHVPYLSKIYR